MAEHQKLSSLNLDDKFHDIYVILSATNRQSRNGPYWQLELRDASGTMEARIWSPQSQSFPSIPAGRAAEIEGKVSMYRDQIQITVESLRILDDDEMAALPLSDYVRASARPATEMLNDIEAMCDRVLTHRPWRKFLRSVLSDKRIRPLLLQAPAAQSVHHAYAGGLLEHMLSVADMCMLMADHYPELDRQTLLAAAVLHDIGKIDEMRGLLAVDYTDKGLLLGHILQGIQMLEPFLQKSGLEPELILHFKHLIASHHGELEFGAICQPCSPEAFALHHADNLDAKLAEFHNVIPESDGKDVVWSSYIRRHNRRLCHITRTPESGAPAADSSATSSREKKKSPQKEEQQCSLL